MVKAGAAARGGASAVDVAANDGADIDVFVDFIVVEGVLVECGLVDVLFAFCDGGDGNV